MRVLVACEFSGTVRDAFLRKGHDATEKAKDAEIEVLKARLELEEVRRQEQNKKWGKEVDDLKSKLGEWKP